MEEYSPCSPHLNRRAKQEPPKPARTPPLQLMDLNIANVNSQIDHKLQAAAPPEGAKSATSNQQISCQTKVISTMAQPQPLNNKSSSPIAMSFQEDATTATLPKNYSNNNHTDNPYAKNTTLLNSPTKTKSDQTATFQ